LPGDEKRPVIHGPKSHGPDVEAPASERSQSHTDHDLGALLLIGLATDAIGRHTALPRVSLPLAPGFTIGPSALHLLPDTTIRWFPVIGDMALLMIGFLLGGKLATLLSRGTGKVILSIPLVDVLMTVCVMSLGLWGLGVELELALVKAGETEKAE
jgi:hypothetical protein